MINKIIERDTVLTPQVETSSNIINADVNQQVSNVTKEEMETEKITLEDGWIMDYISPLDYQCNLARYRNWMARVDGFDDNGKQKREYLTKAKYSDDAYFFVGEKLKEDDVVAVGCHDTRSWKSKTSYYKVLSINEEMMELSEPQTTYLKAKKITK